MYETPGAFDFIDSILQGSSDSTKVADVAKAVDDKANDNDSVAAALLNQPIEGEDVKSSDKVDNLKVNPSEQVPQLSEILVSHEDSDDIVDAIEEIEVIDGMALLEEDEKEDRKDNEEVFIETGVEEGQPLAPSKKRKDVGAPVKKFSRKNIQETYYVENDFRISHKELMVGGPVPSEASGKDDLIRRLRLFINELNNHLEKSESKQSILKKEYSKKIIEVKESEELVHQLTGRLTEQAKVVREQIKEVEQARSVRRQNPARSANNEVIVLPHRLSQVAIGDGDEQLARALQESKKPIGEDLFLSQQTLIGEILAKDSFPGFTYKLTIKKPPLGFTLKKDEGTDFCKVLSISRNDLKKSGLVTGLQILSINGKSLRMLPLLQVMDILEKESMPVEIRMRRALAPWQKYSEFQTTSWGTKKAITTWTFYCSGNKPRIVVLEHNQRKGKSKRKVLVDGEIRYERKSTEENFKFTIDNDVFYIKIRKGKDAVYSYKMRINELAFDEAKTSFIIARTEIV